MRVTRCVQGNEARKEVGGSGGSGPAAWPSCHQDAEGMLPLPGVGLVTHPSLIFVPSRPCGPSVWTSGVRGGLAMSGCPRTLPC